MSKILITGVPGVGKTTLIKKLCEDIAPYGPVGFYTAEIREGAARPGFELTGLDRLVDRRGDGCEHGIGICSPPVYVRGPGCRCSPRLRSGKDSCLFRGRGR